MKNAKLKWCKNHEEPTWVYSDGSFSCMWQLMVETRIPGHCVIVDHIPKEVMVSPTTKPGCRALWKCINSVSGVCEYDVMRKHINECLHCGKPERK